MVYASEALGAPPVKAASLWTSSGFLSHHSPVLYERVLITSLPRLKHLCCRWHRES